MKNKTVVITGATGMLALALMRRLTTENCYIYAVVRPGSSRISNIPKSPMIKIVECDLKDYQKLSAMISVQCDAFFHFAWDGTYGAARNDMELQTNNIRYSIYAAKTAAELGCKVFLGAGSQAEYGRKEAVISPETSVFPENGYGMAKLCAGQMTRIVCQSKGVKHIWCRIFSTYGPYDGKQTLVMSCISKLLNGEKPSCTKGEQMWDYLYCDDAAKAFCFAVEKGVDGSVYCIGSGQARKLSEYITEIRHSINSSAQIGFGELPYSKNQVMYLCADISSLTEDTGFFPEYSFTQGISKTIEWVKLNND